MNPFFRITQGQTTPSLDAALIDSDGQVVNLTGATVNFELYELGGETLIFDQPGDVVDPVAGWVRYSWSPGETDTVGKYLGKFVVTYSNMTEQEFPEKRFIEVTVE